MVTVALESWQFNCKSTRPSRGGLVRLCADAICVPVVYQAVVYQAIDHRASASHKGSGPSDGKSNLPVTSSRVLHRKYVGEHVSSKVSGLAGSSLLSRSHLFSAFLVSR